MKTLRPAAVLSVLALLAAAGWGAAGCSRSAPPPPEGDLPDAARPADGEFSVMTFNLDRYALPVSEGLDDAAPAAPPPGADAIVRAIRQASPDDLAVQGMGPPDAWADFRFRLRQAGLDYRFEEYLSRDDDQELRLAVLSRHPIVSRSPRLRDRYTIGPGQFPVLRGFIELDIEPDPGYRFRLFVTHLKSKRFHEYGQAEMRRNEARLLANHIRASLQENPGLNLLVAGDFSDEPGSRALREVLFYQGKPVLFDLRPADAEGDAWTRRTDADRHLRTSFLLVNGGMLNEVLPDKTRILQASGLRNATAHRPLIAVFAAREQGPESAPDLSERRPVEYPEYD